MKKIISLFILMLFVCSTNLQAQSPLSVAEDFLVKDIQGNSYTLFSILDEGKIVVLPFFTTTCGSCNIYTPEIVLSHQDFGCNQGDVLYLGINYGADNVGVENFIMVHAVGYPCASGNEGLGNLVDGQFQIETHITTLVITPDRQIVGQFYGPNYYPEQDTLNNLLISLGAQMQNCTTSLNETLETPQLKLSPNPSSENFNLSFYAKNEGYYLLSISQETGKTIHQQSYFLQKGSQEIAINLKSTQKGLYFVQLISPNGTFVVEKLLKQ
ncbi:MAG: hypothetical protein B7C24_09430 [Bacteroidetes bacterium 4572_77]|nr:MAG: hypothetical protein B7C24_09430 [Bacteroidetes bacterium 4572_77]